MNSHRDKIWKGGASTITETDISDIMTVEDTVMDSLLLDYEVLSLMAYHIQIYEQDLIPDEDSKSILRALLALLHKKVVIDPWLEDIHGYVEASVGEMSGRSYENLRIFLSRNEQSHTDIRLFQRDHLLNVAKQILNIAETAHKKGIDALGYIPGYTHYRQAMPVAIRTYYDYISSVMVHMSLDAVRVARTLMEESPFGYGSGFGSLSPINFEKVSESLGFLKHMENPLSGSFHRGLDDLDVVYILEKSLISLSRIAQDMIIYSTGDHAFIKLPEDFTTGSSLMANKRNPDFLEMIQGYASVTIAGHVTTASILENKSSGYHREFQISKDKTIDLLTTCEKIFKHFNTFLSGVNIDGSEGRAAMDNSTYATSQAYSIFGTGKTWKESYRQVGDMVRAGGKFKAYDPEFYESVNQKILDEIAGVIDDLVESIRIKRETIVQRVERIIS
ncbi:MAG: lyase family protein [Candidatus Thermoplasmatota archaeon]|nr:lyase family protein [Candidatus Thermoplasmatota archaeon]